MQILGKRNQWKSLAALAVVGVILLAALRLTAGEPVLDMPLPLLLALAIVLLALSASTSLGLTTVSVSTRNGDSEIFVRKHGDGWIAYGYCDDHFIEAIDVNEPAAIEAWQSKASARNGGH